MAGKMLLLYVACSGVKEAERISEKIVKEKLCVCTNIISEVKSTYLWKNKLVKEREAILICKVLDRKKSKCVREIRRMHSYGVPFIGEIKLSSVNKDYLKWAPG